MADVAEEQMVDMVEVTWKGKTYQLTEADAQGVRQHVVDTMRPYVDALSRTLALNVKTLQKYRDTAEFNNNALKAVSLLIVLRVGGIEIPGTTLSSRATAAMTKVEGVMSAAKVGQLGTAIAEAERAINALSDETEAFLKQITGTSNNVGTGLAVASAAGFAVLGAVGAAALVGAGASALAASAISAASVKALEGEINLLGKLALGQSLEPWDLVTLNVDTLVAAITGGISGSIKPEVMGPIARFAAAKVAPRVTSMTVEQIEALLLKYLTGRGAEFAATALNQTIETLVEMAKKGRLPTEKELIGYLQTNLVGLLSAGILQRLEAGNGKLTAKISQVFEGKLVPDAVKKIAAAAVENKKVVEIATAVAKKLGESAMKAAGNGLANSARGDESADALATLGANAVSSDSSLKRLVDAEERAQRREASLRRTLHLRRVLRRISR